MTDRRHQECPQCRGSGSVSWVKLIDAQIGGQEIQVDHTMKMKCPTCRGKGRLEPRSADEYFAMMAPEQPVTPKGGG